MDEAGSGGSRLYGYRQGDRSEYLAAYALSRVAFLAPVPRQEDFGVVDFRCVLARREANRVVPGETFNVQVKSSRRRIKFGNRAVRWISTNMDSPLFVCVVNKKQEQIELYSCQYLLAALFFRMHPQAVTLIPNQVRPDGQSGYVHHPLNTGDSHIDIEGEFDVFLGPPVIAMTLEDFEARGDEVSHILAAWTALDRLNVGLIRMGRAAVWAYPSWQPNRLPEGPAVTPFSRADPAKWSVNEHGLLDKIRPVLDSLRASYERAGRPERAVQTQELINSIDKDVEADSRAFVERLFA
jgi:hypothetical protein